MTTHAGLIGVYRYPLVALSIFIAILAAYAALDLGSRVTTASGGRRLAWLFGAAATVGSGIWAMHYVGMQASSLPDPVSFHWHTILLSLLAVILASALALLIVTRPTLSLFHKVTASVIMGLGIAAMHYIGMAAVTVEGGLRHGVNLSSLSLDGIVFLAPGLLVIVFLSSSMERRLSNQALQFEENLAHLQAVFHSMTDAILVVDFEKETVEHNYAAGTILGLTKKITSLLEIRESYELFMPTGELVSPEERPLMRASRGDFITRGEFLWCKTGAGAMLTMEITTVPIAAADNKGSRVIISFRDVGDRKIKDETHTRLAAIVEFSEDAIIGKDYDGIVIAWNRGAEKIFGYTTVEMVGRPVDILHPPGRLEENAEILQRLRNGEALDQIETERVKKDGAHITVSLTISPICDADGNVVGASEIARDITEKKKMEHQLLQSQKMDAIGQLTGGIAHDFNNLLGVVIGNLDLLERHVGDDPAALKRVQTAQKASLRGADLTRRLLAFSSNEILSPAPTQLHHLISNIIELTHRVIGPEIEIVTQFDESISLILIDAASLESALVNLVVNARDAMPKGGAITISTENTTLDHASPFVLAGEVDAGRYARISVSDSGDGMSRQTLERVFEPFFTTKTRGKGTGLGLPMVYGFVKQSHGTVHIYSEPGFGTTVSLYLPIAEDLSLHLPKAIERPRSFDGGATVLVVDDEVDLLEIAVNYLADMGCKAYTAVDGNDALQVLQRENGIDLLVTDIIMPGGMNGVELAHKVREVNPKIKVIYCSGFPADALAARSMPLVDGPLLRKPYQRDELNSLVRRVMATGDGESS
jgi:PAS domain S-box-containing protein